MPRFRKKPVVIEAVQWNGEDADLWAILELTGDEVGGIGHPANGILEIPTLEGTMTAQCSDWIIRGVQGELYPCKPDIFDATYETADLPPLTAATEQPEARK